MKEALAITGGVIGTFSTVPYLIDVVKGKTKPNIVSWSTWTLLMAIATAAAFAAHAPRSAFLTLGDTFCVFAVVILGLKYGVAKMTLFDAACQGLAVLGLILWLIFNSPSIALIFSIVVDFVVALPTIKHSWNDPTEETWQAFAIATVASIFTLVSLDKYAFTDLAFPAYLLFANGAIATVVVYRRKHKQLSLSR